MADNEQGQRRGALRADKLLQATATAVALGEQLQRLDLSHSAPVVRRSIETALATARYQVLCLRLARDAVAASGGYVLSEQPDHLDAWVEQQLAAKPPITTEQAEAVWGTFASGAKARRISETRLQEEIDRSERRARRQSTAGPE